MSKFIHLHNHSDFSLLDGAASISAYVKKAKECGMTSLALTDHGNMFGALYFYNECRANGINPIIGCEFYVNPKDRSIFSKSFPDGPFFMMMPLSFIYSLLVLIPSLALCMRRLHDVAVSGGMIFIGLIPLIGAIWLFALFCLPSLQRRE